MERKLGGLPDRTAKNAESGDGQINRTQAKTCPAAGQLVKYDGAGRGPDHQNAEHEPEVPYSVDDKGLVCCIRCGIPAKPMANQNIRADAYQLPEDEQHDEVVGQDQPEHGEHEKRQPGKVTGAARVLRHVSQGVNVDDQTDPGDDQQHHFSEVVDLVAHPYLESVQVDPGETPGGVRSEKYCQSEQKRDRYGSNRKKRAEPFKSICADRNDNSGDKRGEEDDPGGGIHWSEFQAGNVFHVCRLFSPVKRHNDGETDCNLGCRYCDNKKDQDLGIKIRQAILNIEPGESDQGQICGVQHEFQGHENDNDISAQQHTREPDGKQQAADHEVIVKRDHKLFQFTFAQQDDSDGCNQHQRTYYLERQVVSPKKCHTDLPHVALRHSINWRERSPPA